MAEMCLSKQHPMLVDEVDQQRKGDEYERRAANEVRGWAIFCGDFENAINLLEKACSLYKPLKACETRFSAVSYLQSQNSQSVFRNGNMCH